MQVEAPQEETQIVCRMAFDPRKLAVAVERMIQEGVELVGYAFEPARDRGQARFWVTNPTNAMLVLEELGLEPRTPGASIR